MWSGYSHCSVTVVQVVLKRSVKCIPYIFSLKTIGMEGPMYEKGVIVIVLNIRRTIVAEPDGSSLK